MNDCKDVPLVPKENLLHWGDHYICALEYLNFNNLKS